jgi:hypothetical protein
MKGIKLGDIGAENNIKMLDGAFLEIDTYKTILSSPSLSVVGRGGTGKSVLNLFWLFLLIPRT